MRRHTGRIALRCAELVRFRGTKPLMAGLALGWGAVGCASTRATGDPEVLTANEAWVQRACRAEMFDTTGWAKYQRSGIQISVPPTHKETSEVPDYLYVRTSRGGLTIWRHRDARYRFDQVNNVVRPGQVTCSITYGGLPAEVVAWNEKGEFGTAIKVAPQWDGDDSDKWLFAMVTSRELAEATMLRHVLRTIVAVPSRESRR